MAGILDGLDTPKWMTPSDWSLASQKATESIGRNVSAGIGHLLQFMQMQNQSEQAMQGMALKKEELDLDKQKQGMLFAAQQAANRDTARLQGVMRGWNSPEPDWDAQPETPYETAQGAANHAKFRGLGMASSASGQAALKMNKRYADIISHDPNGHAYGELQSLEDEYGKNSPQWREAFGRFGAQMDKDKEDEAARLRAIVPTINAESRENVAILRSMQMDEQAKSSGDGTPALMADGTPVPGMVKFWTGRTWQYRNVHDPNDVKSMTPSQQISGLNSLIRVNKGIAEGGFATPEEAKAAHAKMLEYTGRLDELMKKHPQAAGVTPETKASKANALSKQHPDWSRQQIIDEVNRQVP